VQVNDFVHIGAASSVVIGRNVLIASRVFISDHDHGSYSGQHCDSPHTPPALRALMVSPVTIEDNVWLGEGVSVLSGVTIGQGSIVAAGAVVTKSIPPYSLAVGVPAVVIKRFNFSSSLWERVIA